MQKKSLELARSSSHLLERIRSNTKHFMSIVKSGWVIKFSIYEYSNILVTIVSSYTDQTIIRYFIDENDAVDFINRVTAESPEKYLNI